MCYRRRTAARASVARWAILLLGAPLLRFVVGKALLGIQRRRPSRTWVQRGASSEPFSDVSPRPAAYQSAPTSTSISVPASSRRCSSRCCSGCRRRTTSTARLAQLCFGSLLLKRGLPLPLGLEMLDEVVFD